MGKIAAVSAMNYLHGDEVKKEYKLPIELLTKDNLEISWSENRK